MESSTATFLLSCAICVFGILAYLRREDNDFARLLRKIDSQAGEMTAIKNSLEEFRGTTRNICASISTDVGEVQGRVTALEEKPRIVEFQITKAVPFTVNVKNPAPKVLPTPAPQVEKKAPKGIGALIPTAPESLLNRAGIRAKKKKELNHQ